MEKMKGNEEGGMTMMTVEPYLPTWGGDEVLLSGRDKESAVQDGRRPLMMEARRGFRAGEMKK